MDIPDHHFRLVANSIIDGRLIPFLGAGVNLCNRTDDCNWSSTGTGSLPNGTELARHLSGKYSYPDSDTHELARVAQYVSVMTGSGPLYDDLRDIFQRDYEPTPVHGFLAELPNLYRTTKAAGSLDAVLRRTLFVTSNYDDVLERALDAAGENYHVVSYIADGPDRGRFMHSRNASDPSVITVPNRYEGLLKDTFPIVLKIHGAICRSQTELDSFVITEDHYIDFLSHGDLASLVPAPLPAGLKRSHFLFLGYGLRDWNLRVILHRIWQDQKLSYRSWAIQKTTEPLEREFWRRRDVEILNTELDSYISRLREELSNLGVLQ